MGTSSIGIWPNSNCRSNRCRIVVFLLILAVNDAVFYTKTALFSGFFTPHAKDSPPEKTRKHAPRLGNRTSTQRLVYLGASLFVTIINEFVAHSLQLRGKQLAKNLKMLIDETGLQNKLKSSSPVLKAFFNPKSKVGSYVDPNVLAQTLAGTLASGATGVAVMKDIIAGIATLPDSSIKKELEAIAKAGKDDVERFVERVSVWADRSLAMLGESYKSNLQVISFCIGFFVALSFNIDTLEVTTRLYQDHALREATVAVAIDLTERTSKETFDRCVSMPAKERAVNAECKSLEGHMDGVLKRNETLGKLPIGWGTQNTGGDLAVWFYRLIGWLLTALALSLGAPFWFDLLNRVRSMRHGMQRPDVAKPKSA
jgi:hypothetical protein